MSSVSNASRKSVCRQLARSELQIGYFRGCKSAAPLKQDQESSRYSDHSPISADVSPRPH
jgi:hypothetical protein